MFAQFSSETAGTEGKFGDLNLDNTVSVSVSADGTAGAKVSVNKALLLSALTIDAGTLVASEFNNAGTGNIRSFAAAENGGMQSICRTYRWVFLRKRLKISQHYAPTTERRCRGYDSPAKTWPSRRPTWWPPWVGSRTWTSRPKAPEWRSTTPWFKPRLPCFSGELKHRRRAHAPEVRHRMSKKIHKFNNRDIRPPQFKSDEPTDMEVRRHKAQN